MITDFICYFHLSVPGASPQNLTAYNTSTSSLYVRWQELVEDKRHGIMEGYELFFYEMTKNDGLLSLDNRTFGLSVLETNFTGLKAYTKYRIEVLGFNNFGDGPAAAIEVFTAEGSKYGFSCLNLVLLTIGFSPPFKQN